MQELGKSCPACNSLLPVDIKKYNAPFKAGGYVLRAVYEDCGCPGVVAAREKFRNSEAERKKQARESRRQARFNAAGLGGWLSMATLDNFKEDTTQNSQNLLTSRQYLDAISGDLLGKKPWIVFHGQYGTGKTHLAAGMIREAIIGGIGPAFFRGWTSYLERLQLSWDGNGKESTRAIIEELQKGKLICLDDLDKRKPSDWAKEILYTVLNFRYNAQLPTIITLNESPLAESQGKMLLAEYVGRPVLDRIIGAAWRIVEFEGLSYRSGVSW